MEDSKKDLEDLCRVCLKASYLEMKSLLDMQNANIVEDIKFCTGVKFTYEVHKPYQICSECLCRLKIAREFKTTCIKSEGIIKEAAVKVELKEDFGDDHVSLDTEEDVKCEASGFENKEYVTRPDCSNPNIDSDKCIIVNEKPKVRRKNRKCVQTKQVKPKKRNVVKIVTPKTSNAVNYKKLYCEKCDVKFGSKEESRAHKAKLHTDDQCICEVCGKTLMSRASIDSHMRFHRPPDYSCDRCGYCTGNKYDLAKHIRIHLDIKQYQCPLCACAYYTNSNLNQHMRRHHGGGEARRFACNHDGCGKTFVTKSKMLIHRDMHDNIKRFPCSVCESAFTRRDYLKKHLEKHHNITIPKLKGGRKKELRVIGKDEPEIT